MGVYRFVSIMTVMLILIAGLGAVWMIQQRVPLLLVDGPRLAAAAPENHAQEFEQRPLKEVIYDAQKKVAMMIVGNGSIGSGFLYNDRGDFVTNAHVVEGANVVKVSMADASEYEGQVIGISEETDVAVVRVPDLVNGEPLPLARERKADIGDEVLALGSPLGLQNTVTTGIISGLDRSFEIEPYVYDNMYQISAPIAPGNSGGPLIDRYTGEVLGINSAAGDRGSIGFSIPISDVLSLIEGWSDEPMTELPADGVDFDSDYAMDADDADSAATFASYLVGYFYDSINQQDFVTAYSLLGSEWQTKTDYDQFRGGYLHTRSVTVDDTHVTGQGDRATVVAILTALERKGEELTTRKYKVVYEVGYENDRLKLLKGTGEEIR